MSRRPLVAVALSVALGGCPTNTTSSDAQADRAPLGDVTPDAPATATATPTPRPEPRPPVPDTENAQVRDATWDKWDMDAMSACGDDHRAQVEEWILALCRVRLDTASEGAQLAGHMALPKLPLPYNPPASKMVINWNGFSTEVPDATDHTGRRLKFRDNPKDSPFHEATIRDAIPSLRGVPILAVDGSRPVREVAKVLAMLKKAGRDQVAFAFETTAYPVPLPPRPEVLEKLEWQAAAPYMREAAKGCGAMTSALQTFAGARPDARCAPLAKDVADAISSCKCKMADPDAFLGNLHLWLKPEKIVTVTTVRLGGKLIRTRGDETWNTAARRLFDQPIIELDLIAR